MRTSLILWVSTLLFHVANAKCIDQSLAEIVSAFDCGNAPTIAECLTQKTLPIEPCLVALGCPAEQIDAGIKWLNNDCSSETHPTLSMLRQLWLSMKPQELRKRATISTTPTAATAAVASATTAVKTTATATSTSSTSLSTSSSSSSSTLSNSISQTDSCVSTSYSSFSYCLTSGTSTCITTSTGIGKCPSGMICATSTADASISCMDIDNSLTTSGLVVTIILAVVLATLVGSLLFMCFSAKRASNAARAKRESTFVTMAEADSHHEDGLPLMGSAGPAGGYSGGYTQTTRGNGVAGSRSPPGLHPGLVGTPTHEEEDISYQSRH